MVELLNGPAVSEHRYAEQWLVIDRKPLNRLTPEEAERRHGSRESYAVLIGDPDTPSRVVLLVGPWVTVSFLDSDLREYLLYSFKELRPGRLFLKQAIHRQFVQQSGEVSTATIFAFSEKGAMIAECQDMRTDKVETRKAKVDLAPNWERYPEFNAYESLLREERGLRNSNGCVVIDGGNR